MKKIEFNCNRHNAPAYSCSEPGDNSGVYVQSTDVDELFEELADIDCLGHLAKLLREHGIG